MQRESYLSTFSEQPGFRRASKATTELFSSKASLIRDRRPIFEILFPEISIDFINLSEASAWVKFYAKPSPNLFLRRMSSLKPELFKIELFLWFTMWACYSKIAYCVYQSLLSKLFNMRLTCGELLISLYDAKLWPIFRFTTSICVWRNFSAVEHLKLLSHISTSLLSP